MIDRVTREKAVMTLLEMWPWELGSTLIGGFALAAYGAARYSNDVDFVIPNEARKPIEKWLADQGFVSASRKSPKPEQVLEATTRLSKGDVNLDLLVGSVRDRDAKVEIPESWIAERARRERLDLRTGSVARNVPVARPEALWALKLQAGRDQDLTDLFAILDTPVKSEEVRGLFRSLRTPNLDAKLSRVKGKLQDAKLYDDSRSRMGLRDTETTRRRWDRFRARITGMVPT